MNKWFKRFSYLTLLFTLLVILAGSIVRMSGSGMGCPDWPKCFGYYIPPYEEEQVLWQPDKVFKSGQMIAFDQALWKAKSNFKTGEEIDLSNWEKYTKHDYAVFNPVHTYTEYINRLCGALLGIMSLGMVFFSFYVKQKKYRLWSVLILILILFEAWLGKEVVDSVLMPAKITTHMLAALVILVLNTYVISMFEKKVNVTNIKPIKLWLVLGLVFGGIQVLLGTQMREEIDYAAKISTIRSEWINFMGEWFWSHTLHTPIYIVAQIILIYLLLKNDQVKELLERHLFNLIGLIVFALFTGVILGFGGMPKSFQPLHLLTGSILFAYQSYLLFRIVRK